MASGKRKVTLQLSPEVADWIESLPPERLDATFRQMMENPEAKAQRILKALEPALARVQMQLAQDIARGLSGPRPTPTLAPALLEALQQLPPEQAARAQALARYPQLVEAVAKGMVPIERAEEMAREADSRS